MIADPVLDPLKIYQRLKTAKVEEKAAKEIASIFGEILENQLATKKDLKEMEYRLEVKMGEMKSDTLKWVIGWTTGLIIAQTGILFSLFKVVK